MVSDLAMSTIRLKRQSHNAGFTLLEILLAMLVLGMVVSMVSLSLSSSISAIDSTQEQGEIYYRAQVAMERISEDLASAVLPEDVEFIGTSGNSDGDSVAVLSFASMAHIVFDPENGQPGMGIINYSVHPDTNDEKQLLLLRSDILYRPQEDQEKRRDDVESFLLCDRLRSVQFSYIGSDGEEVETWNTTVDDGEDTNERQLPSAVSCSLEFWINQEEETSVTFEATVILPVAMIHANSNQDE